MGTDKSLIRKLDRDIEKLEKDAKRLKEKLASIMRRLTARKELRDVELGESRKKNPKPSQKSTSIETKQSEQGGGEHGSIREVCIQVMKDIDGPIKLKNLVKEIEKRMGRKLSTNYIWVLLSRLIKDELVERKGRGKYRMRKT